MQFWPFWRKEKLPETAPAVRDWLIEGAASGSVSKLTTRCQLAKAVVAERLDVMAKLPDEIMQNPAAIDRHMHCMIAVAQCLAQQCAAPELWNKLVGTPDNNPLLKWDRWYGEMDERAERLEHAALIAEAQEYIAEARALQGAAARQNEAFLLGRMGELLFHSGRVAESIPPHRAALRLCEGIGDVQGQFIYLHNLMESHRYLGQLDEATALGKAAITVGKQHGLPTENALRQVHWLERGEPLCRVVCVRDGKDIELENLVPVSQGRFSFEFRRNRLPLRKTAVLVRQAGELSSQGELAAALEKLEEAADVDPLDPDPPYQSGACLLDLGAYAQARERYAETERLAPGWFHCRFEGWLAERMEQGQVTSVELQLLRALQDGGLPPDQAQALAEKAITDFPRFAPFYLSLGTILGNRSKTESAIKCFRRGLELDCDPDLESRLLCAAAGFMPLNAPERAAFVARAVSLKGSLVAHATAVLLGISAGRRR